jgi:hypothetical protein
MQWVALRPRSQRRYNQSGSRKKTLSQTLAFVDQGRSKVFLPAYLDRFSGNTRGRSTNKGTVSEWPMELAFHAGSFAAMSQSVCHHAIALQFAPWTYSMCHRPLPSRGPERSVVYCSKRPPSCHTESANEYQSFGCLLLGTTSLRLADVEAFPLQPGT